MTIEQRIAATQSEMERTKPRSRRMIELEVRLRDLRLLQLWIENKKGQFAA